VRVVAGTALAGAVSVFALVSAAAAVGAPTWAAPVQLSAPLGGSVGAYRPPSVALDPAGDAVVGWAYFLGGDGLAQVVSRTAGSTTWSAPLNLAEGTYRGITLVMDASGNAFAAFIKGYGLSSIVQVSERRGPAGAWEDPVTLSPQPPAEFGAWIAVGPAGDVGVLATQFTGHGFVIQGTVRRAGATTWAPLADVSDRSGGIGCCGAVGVDGAGNATAIWNQFGEGANPSVMKTADHSSTTGAWGTPVDVPGSSGDVPGDVPQVAIDAAGNATATWVSEMPDLGAQVVESSYRPFGGTWGPAVVISGNASRIYGSSLVVDRAGNALALWQADGAVESAVRSASKSAWQSPVEVSPDAHQPELAMDEAGNAVAVWVDSSSVRAALRPAANGVWQPPEEIKRSGFDFLPAVAMGPTGRAVAVWGGRSGVVEGSDLVPAGPLLDHVAVPSSGTVRVPVRFSVNPVPWASPLLGGPVWQFGDGSSATGQAVTHVYVKPGNYTVSVAQADATGSSTASGPIGVVAPTLTSLSQPSIRGVAEVGRTPLCLTGIWTGTAPIRYRYSWLRKHTAIPGATRRRYTLRQDDARTSIACRVTAKNLAGTMSKLSRPVLVQR
jgi:PKD domain